MHGYNTKIMVASMVVVGVGLLVAAWFAWRPTSQAPTTSLLPPPSTPPVFLLNGPLPMGFPKDLILEARATYSVTTASSSLSQATSNGNRYFVQWSSSSSVDAVFNSYQNYFSKNGWTATVADQNPKNPAVRVIRATKDSLTVGVAIVPRTQDTFITIGYTVK